MSTNVQVPTSAAPALPLDNMDYRAPGTEILQLTPEELLLDEHTDVRPWEATTPESIQDESERIQRLAATIEEEGQIQAVVAREVVNPDTGTVSYYLIAGRRRRAAIKLINDRHVKEGSVLRLPVNVSILRNVSDDSAFRKSMMENVQRLQLSPMQVAVNISTTRKRMGWEDKKDWSKRISEFLGVSRGFVTQKMKLLELPDAMQADIHAGKLSEEAAWVAIKVKPAKLDEVTAAATQKARDEAAAKAAKSGNAAPEATTEPTADGVDPTVTATPPAGEVKVTEEHMTAAARETPDSTDKPLGPLSRKELVQSFEQFDATPYGHPNGDVRKFVVYLVDVYAKGTGTPTMFKRLFNKMTASANQGTPEPEKAKAEPVTGKGATTKAAPPAKAKAKKAA